jgi:hypothetical protein
MYPRVSTPIADASWRLNSKILLARRTIHTDEDVADQGKDLAAVAMAGNCSVADLMRCLPALAMARFGIEEHSTRSGEKRASSRCSSSIARISLCTGGRGSVGPIRWSSGRLDLEEEGEWIEVGSSFSLQTR